jgi:phosphonoacetaldehyde hydrolase
VVKIGDTVPDIEEGLNAGAWSVGVSETGSELGLSEAELTALPRDERDLRTSRVRAKLLAAGAHYVIDSVRDLPDLLPEIERRMQDEGASARASG